MKDDATTNDLSKRLATLSPAKRALLEHKLPMNAAASQTRGIQPRGESGPAPLSFAQQRLWLYDQLEPDTPNHNPRCYRISGDLDGNALQNAFDAIVERHETLRTTFALAQGEAVQVIHPARPVAIQRVDLSHLSESQREDELSRWIKKEAEQLFDLSRDAMLRVGLVRLAPAEHVLAISIHHIATDGWSGNVLLRELAALYGAFRDEKPSPLPVLPIQYADFAHWQRQRLTGELLESQLSYWTKHLAGSNHELELPADRPRPSVHRLRGASHRAQLPDALSAELKALSNREGATPYMMLLAAFYVLLHRTTRQEDINLGSYIANRNRTEIEGLIGFFVNTIVLRADLSGNPTFRELLRRVRDTAIGAFAHQELPFERLLEAISPKRDRSRTPLFQAVFVMQNASDATLELPGLTCCPLDSCTTVSLHDLTLSILPRGNRLHTTWVYNTDLFDGSTIARMADHFRTLLEAIVVNPDEPIASLPLLTSAQRRQILSEWSGAEISQPTAELFPRQFEARSRQTPDAVAVERQGQRLTYAQLNARANQLAHLLQKRGVGPEVRVGVCVERSLDMVVALLGVWKAGGAYVPMDPNYPPSRLAFILENAGAPVLLTQRALFDKLPPHNAETICLDADGNTLACESEANPASATTAETLAYVIYTSGSTGKPKGVMVAHGALAHFVEASIAEYGLATADRILQFASISFDASVEEIFPCLALGATLVLRTDSMMDSISTFLQKCGEWGITVASLPTAFWHEVVARLETAAEELPAALRLVMIGGERALPERLAEWHKYARPGVRLLNTYGPTEATVVATVCDVSRPNGSNHALKEVPIGRPLRNTHVYILDPHLQPVPVGIPGELHIGGTSLARGYVSLPDLTLGQFIPNPFRHEAGTRLYRTGDVVRWLPGGSIEFLGRVDHQVKIRGFRVELGEVEAVLREHPSVRDGIVVDREDAPGVKRLVAYTTARVGETPSVSGLRSFLKERLPEYMVPSAFVVLETLPLMPSGKVDRNALPAPNTDRPELESKFATPRNSIEDALVAVWSQVLGLQQVGIHDDFFELGGHSLLATRVVSRLRSVFHLEIPLRALFEAPTVAGLAAVVNQRIDALSPANRTLLERQLQSASTEAAIEAIPCRTAPGPAPLSFSQQRLWFLDQWEPGSAAYNVSMAILMEGDLNVGALEQSLAEILRRHEVLRTTFSSEGDMPVQIVHPPNPFRLPRVNLATMPAEQKEAELQKLAREEAARPFNLASGPMLRATLLNIETRKHALLLTMHHIASDGWSMSVLFRESSVLYEAFSKGNPSPLPEMPIQYADFAMWQRASLQGEKLDGQLTYWREQLRGAPTLDLPIDRPRPREQTFRGARHVFRLPKHLMEALQSLSRMEDATLFMTLIAAFQSLLARYTGQEDIVLGSPIAGRTRTELESLIGFFVNMLVLRTDVSGDPTFRELLARARQAALAAYEHQDIPFEKLVEELHPQRDPSRNPLFQVAFALQNAPRSTLSLPGLTLSRLDVGSSRIRFDLEVHLTESSDGLRGLVVYNTDLFEEATIERMAGHFQTMLEAIAADPNQRLSQLPLLTENERDQLLFKWNNTQTVYPREASIPELFEAQAQNSPDATAVIFEDCHLTYRQLNERANQLAHYLRRLGVGPDVLVGICVERSIEMIIGILGILKAGGAYVPLEPTYPGERLAFMLEDANAFVLVTQESLRPNLPHSQAQILCVDGQELANESRENPSNNATASNLAYVIYTSGSTGQPKGVAVPHRAVVRLVRNTNYVELTPADRIAQASNASFDALTFEVWGALLNGASLVLLPQVVVLSPREFMREIREKQVSTLFLTTALFNQMANECPSAFQSLRYLLFGGEICDPNCVRKILKQQAPQHLLHVYGPTENTTFTTWYRIERLEDEASTVPIGRPISNTYIYILDRHRQAVPIGVIGELYIGGDGLARGYLNRAELTGKRFVDDVFGSDPSARLYSSGDLARYRSDGNVEFVGRADQQVKIRGFRIELEEIEAVLSQHASVSQSVVVARQRDDGDKRLVAFIVPHKGQRIAAEELRQFLRETLPAYMMPAAFVELDSLPLTPNGKVDRKALPDVEVKRPDLGVTVIEPRSSVEEHVARIWSELLGIPGVRIHDNFFDLGGHSLLFIQLISRLHQQFEVELPVRTLFNSPTVAQLAARIEESRHGTTKGGPDHEKTWTYLVPIQTSGTQNPLFLVPGGGGGEDEFLVYARMARLVGDNFPFYGLQARGCDGQREPHTRVEQMATDYIQEMRLFQPNGPYCIAGECIGGIVAYEMGRQLMAQKQQVALLLLLDTPRPTIARYLRYCVGPFVESLRNRWKELRQMQWRERFNYFLHKAHRSVLAAVYALHLKPTPELEGKQQAVQHIRRVREGYPRSLLRYKPKPYGGRVTLITNETWYQRNQTQGWVELARGGIELIRVPGTHHSYIRADVQTTAVHLRACLENAARNET